MGKLALFEISFGGDKSIYHPGEDISGKVTVKLNAPMQLKMLKIIFNGRAHVSWEDGSDDNKSSYSASQIFFSQETMLYGNGNIAASAESSEHCELAAGEHTFPFSFPLPYPLPSSYEDSVGFVRYYVKASIVKPWKFDHNTKKVFTVLDTLNLNNIPDSLTTAGASLSKNICCLCCKSGPIELDFYVDRTGYVPGEWIVINASINNCSNRRIHSTSAELCRNVTYRAQAGEKNELKFICKISGPGCPSKRTVNWTNKKLKIPPLPPTELMHCRLIDIEYVVQFTVRTPACSGCLQGQAPIVIGTVPIRSLPQYNNPSSANMFDGDIRISLTPPPSFSTLPENDLDVKYNNFAPPPSYAAAMEGSADIRDQEDNEFTMGEMSYTPHYTYYDWNETDLPPPPSDDD